LGSPAAVGSLCRVVFALARSQVSPVKTPLLLCSDDQLVPSICLRWTNLSFLSNISQPLNSHNAPTIAPPCDLFLRSSRLDGFPENVFFGVHVPPSLIIILRGPFLAGNIVRFAFIGSLPSLPSRAPFVTSMFFFPLP